jgi:hypothetical protein
MDAIVGKAFYKSFRLAGSLLFVSTILAGDGYMSVVGPKPLRFAIPAQRLDPEKVLPPLKMEDEQPIESSTASEASAPRGSSGAEENGSIVIESSPASSEPLILGAQKVLTPEHLVQYFTPGRRNETVISTQVEFTPPAPASSRSSTATYISK